MRYPENKISVTGRYEPWHIRYVGEEAAAFMKNHDLALEEFVNLYH
jgi:D-alanyl-D-alanine carboxypeptidase